MNAIPLVLLHGYPFNHTMWDKVRGLLNTDVLAPDLRGFGPGGTPGGEPALDLMADDVIELLDQNGFSSAVVAGFSMGGYVTLSLAERFPARLAGFGLINSQVQADSDEARAGRRLMIQKVQQEGPGVAAAAAIPKLFSSTNPMKEELAGFARRAAEQAGVAGITWALEAMARRPDRSAALKKLGVPVLLIYSTEDQFIPVGRSRALAEQTSGAIAIEIPRVGHCSPLEVPEVVAKGFRELMDRAESQSSEALLEQSISAKERQPTPL